MSVSPTEGRLPKAARRFDSVETSLIRQINALATPLAINLGIGEPNVEPDEHLREMAAQAALTGSWHYTANAGSLQLREQIVSHMAPSFDPRDEICVTAGTELGLYSVMLAFINEGDEVLVPDPGFVAYETLARICGGVAVPYPLEPGSWELDVEALAERITPATRMIVVNSPSNPTGSILDQNTFQRLAELAERHQLVLVSDEVYSEIYYDAPPSSAIQTSGNVVILNGLSKSHSMTGLRLGWVAAHRELMKPISMAHQYIATCASSFSQQLATMIFLDEEWNRRWLSGVRRQFREQRDAAVAAVRHFLDSPVPAPAGAFYLFVPVPVCETVSFARSLATEAAVLAIPGVAFGRQGEGFLRISFASPPDDITKGVRRISEHLNRSR